MQKSFLDPANFISVSTGIVSPYHLGTHLEERLKAAGTAIHCFTVMHSHAGLFGSLEFQGEM